MDEGRVKQKGLAPANPVTPADRYPGISATGMGAFPPRGRLYYNMGPENVKVKSRQKIESDALTPTWSGPG